MTKRWTWVDAWAIVGTILNAALMQLTGVNAINVVGLCLALVIFFGRRR